MRVAVVITVKNEVASIAGLLASLDAQTRPPDQLIIVDGGSTDGTCAIIRAHQGPTRVELQESRGSGIAAGVFS